MQILKNLEVLPLGNIKIFITIFRSCADNFQVHL